MDPTFRKQVKDALEHLYDTAYLQVHPLLSQITDIIPADQTTRAQKLRGLLKDTIEALRPQQGSPSTSPEWRSYLALRYRYVQGMSMWQIENELGISLRQLQRELHEGLDALSQVLWDMRIGGTPDSTQAQPTPSELQELQNELSQWQLTREPCAVKALIEDTLWMLKPTLGQATSVQVTLPDDLPPVLVDSTLTCQALLKLTRLLTQQSDSVLITANRRHRHVEIILQGRQSDIQASVLDVQMADLLISQQGGTLAIQELPEGAKQVVLNLPCSAQTRVMVIDDNQAIHRLFERYLATQHYDVIHAYSGQEALQLAAETHPDLITLDVMMPHIDGWQILRDLTQDENTRDIPVVVCSVLREPDLALSLGARAYLKKPVDRLELLATLARVRGAAAPVQATPQPKIEER